MSAVRPSARSRVRRRPAAVSLVSLPFKDLKNPPIQLGILQRALSDAGIASRAHSLELAFMEDLHRATAGGESGVLTIEDYQNIAHKQFHVQLGDWIFKVPPYAEIPALADDEYLRYIRGEGIKETAITNAIRMREVVPSFLKRAVREILSGKPRIVGFSTVFQQNVASLVLSKMLKEADPSLVVIFGGDNCDGVMGAALHESFPWVDVVVRGEGERVLVEVARDVLAERPIRPQPGLCYRDGSRSIAVPPEERPTLPMNEVPSPIYDEYFERLDKSPIRDELRPQVSILFESSRGCWWGAKSHCTFCGLNASTMAFRSKPAQRVADEILDLAQRYKVLKFIAVDDIIDLAHVRDLLPLLRDSNCDLDIYYETKANLSKEQLRMFRAAGISGMQPGIESLSTPILRLMRKGVTALQNVRLLKWCAEIGITPDWNLLWGFPGEPPEEYERMAKMIPSLVHLQAPSITQVQIQRFSPYFERPAEFGLEIAGPMPYYEHLYPVRGERLANLVYDFDHRYADGRDPASYVGDVQKAVALWREAENAESNDLTFRRGPGFLIVEDRRHGIETADYQFGETEAKIYLACDAGATVESIHAELAAGDDSAPDRTEIEEFLDELVELRLMLREDNRFLSLAIAPPGLRVPVNAAATTAAVNA